MGRNFLLVVYFLLTLFFPTSMSNFCNTKMFPRCLWAGQAWVRVHPGTHCPPDPWFFVTLWTRQAAACPASPGLKAGGFVQLLEGWKRKFVSWG